MHACTQKCLLDTKIPKLHQILSFPTNTFDFPSPISPFSSSVKLLLNKICDSLHPFAAALKLLQIWLNRIKSIRKPVNFLDEFPFRLTWDGFGFSLLTGHGVYIVCIVYRSSDQGYGKHSKHKHESRHEWLLNTTQPSWRQWDYYTPKVEKRRSENTWTLISV